MNGVKEFTGLGSFKGWLTRNIGGAVKSYAVMMDPEMAAELMEINTRNKPIRSAYVRHLKAQIENGKWDLTPDGIAISDKGVLLNGQHRLKAIIETESTLPVFIQFNLSHDSFWIIDSHGKRTSGDIFAIHGVKNATSAAAVTRYYWSFIESGTPRSSMSDHEELHQFYLTVGAERVQGTVLDIVHPASKRRVPSPTMLGGLYLLCSDYSKPQADLYFKQLATGDIRDHKAPVSTVRDRIMVDKHELSRDAVAAIVIRGWNAWRDQAPLDAFRYRYEGKIPKVH